MGAISDGSYEKFGYGTGADQTDMAKVLRLQNPYGSHTVLGTALATGLPSLFMMVGQKCASSIGSGKEGDAESSADVETAKKEMQNILDKYGCSTISEVEAKVQTAKLAEQKSKEHDTLVTNLSNKVTEYYNQRSVVDSLQNNINDLRADIVELQMKPDLSEEEKTQLQNLTLQKAEKENRLEAEQKKLEVLEQEAEQLTQDSKNLYTEIESLLSNIKTGDTIPASADIEKDVKSLQYYEKVIKRADGREAMEKYKNEETGDITAILKKLNNARSSGDTKRESELTTKLEEAIEKYYKEHKVGDNKTIDSLPQSKKYLSKK